MDVFVDEIRGGAIKDFKVWVFLSDRVTDRVEKVGFTQAGVAVDKKRVIKLARVFRDHQRGLVGFAVGLTDDEILKGIVWIEMAFLEEGRFFINGSLFFEVLLLDENQTKIGSSGLEDAGVKETPVFRV